MRYDIASAHLSRLLLAACIAATMAACGSPAVTPPGEDAGVPQPDGGCTSSAECSDDVFCNGVERCMDGVCLPSSAPACTGTDRCDEVAKTCGGVCVDADGDGACAEDDCDDANPNRFPGALERCDTADEDCNPATLGPDGDGDGSSAIDCCNPQSSGAPLCGNDCDDTRATVNTTALESCNGRDDDCDALIDEDVQIRCFADGDSDGYALAGAIPSLTCVCGGESTATDPTTLADCDDADAEANPAVPEVCNAVDDNCTGGIDEGLPLISLFVDADGDDFGAAPTMVCGRVPGTAEVAGDCNDASAVAFPGGVEICDGIDNDCNGATDEVLGAPCTRGVGGCAVGGNLRCDGTCTAVALAPSSDGDTPAANGSWDRNCNGMIESNWGGEVISDVASFCAPRTMATCATGPVGLIEASATDLPPYCGVTLRLYSLSAGYFCRWTGSACVLDNTGYPGVISCR